MPSFKDVEVHITTMDGVPLQEWGVQKMGKAQIISCFVESKTDMPFSVSIKPTIPFPEFVQQAAAGVTAEEVTEYGGWIREETESEYSGRVRTLRREITKRAPKPSEAPYHLLATMRLDGREKFEKQTIIYLDANHPHFNTDTNGRATLRSRLMHDDAGAMRQCGWVFRDIGIDTLFDALGLDSNDPRSGAEIPLTGEDDLAQAFARLGEGELQDRPESSAGKIEVALERVTVGRTESGAWTPAAASGAAGAHDASARDSLADVSHTVGRDFAARTVSSASAIFYEKVDGGEVATFRFFYRNAETLRKFGFAGFAAGRQAPGAMGRGVLAAGQSASVGGMMRKRGGDEGEAGLAKRPGPYTEEMVGGEAGSGVKEMEDEEL